MPELPSMVCPKCRGALEYHATIEMLNPPIGKIDTGYCAACARLFERVRETNTFYDSTLWPPLCRVCRQPVAFVGLWAGEDQNELLRYECREHSTDGWILTRGTDHWSRAS
jgi:hypothetical protein